MESVFSAFEVLGQLFNHHVPLHIIPLSQEQLLRHIFELVGTGLIGNTQSLGLCKARLPGHAQMKHVCASLQRPSDCPQFSRTIWQCQRFLVFKDSFLWKQNVFEGRGEEALGPGLCPPFVGGHTVSSSTQRTYFPLKDRTGQQLPQSKQAVPGDCSKQGCGWG